MPKQCDYQSPIHMPDSTVTCATAALLSTSGAMEQVERVHIQTSEVEIIAARIEADLSHVVGTYWALTAISAANGKKIPIASP
jgi:hypothetical protein